MNINNVIFSKGKAWLCVYFETSINLANVRHSHKFIPHSDISRAGTCYVWDREIVMQIETLPRAPGRDACIYAWGRYIPFWLLSATSGKP